MVRVYNHKSVMKLGWLSAFLYLCLVTVYLIGSCHSLRDNISDARSLTLIVLLDAIFVCSSCIVLFGYKLKRLSEGWTNRIKQTITFVVQLILLFFVGQFLFLLVAFRINQAISGIDLMSGDSHGTIFMIAIAVNSIFVGVSFVLGAALLLVYPVVPRGTSNADQQKRS